MDKKIVIKVEKGLKIDRIVALHFLVRHVLKTTLKNIQLWFDANPPEGALEVDYFHYLDQGQGSATAVVFYANERYEVPGAFHLLQEMNANNIDGHLKKGLHSFSALVRDLSDMASVKTEDIIQWYFRVLERYYAAMTKMQESGFTESLQKRMSEWNSLKQAIEETHGNIWETAHFLYLDGYVFRMFILGMSTDEILAEVKFWLEKFAAAKDWRDSANQIAAEIRKVYAPLGQGKNWIVAIKTDHPRVLGAVLNSRNTNTKRPGTVVAINHSPEGNISVLCRLPQGAFDKLAEHLPGWHLETRFQNPMLLLGSMCRSNSEGEPVSQTELIQLIQDYVDPNYQPVPKAAVEEVQVNA